MNKTILKIGLIVMPIICYMVTGWIFSYTISSLYNSGILEFNPLAFLMETLEFVVLGFAIYYSIKLWIKYVEKP